MSLLAPEMCPTHKLCDLGQSLLGFSDWGSPSCHFLLWFSLRTWIALADFWLCDLTTCGKQRGPSAGILSGPSLTQGP